MRIWLISEIFFPDEVSTAYIMSSICEELSLNYEVSVICGPSNYLINKKWELNRDRITLYRVKFPVLNKNKLVQRFISGVCISFLMSIIALIKIKKGERVLLVTNPPLIIPCIAIVKLFKRFNLSILVHDVFPENLWVSKGRKLRGWVFNSVKFLFDLAYRSADRLIVLGSDMLEVIREKVGNNKPIEIITNWADIEEVYPLSTKPDILAEKYFNTTDVLNKIIILFAGNLGRMQGLERFLKLFLQADNPDLALILLGNGTSKVTLETILANNKSKGIVKIYPSKGRKEQVFFLNSCHLGLITLKEEMFGLGVPSKSYNILAAGKPIFFVGDTTSEIGTMVKENNIGWSFNWTEEIAIIEFLQSLKPEISKQLIDMGERGRKLVCERFHKAIILDMFNKHFCNT